MPAVSKILFGVIQAHNPCIHISLETLKYLYMKQCYLFHLCSLKGRKKLNCSNEYKLV
jgi:hypothetical protein